MRFQLHARNRSRAADIARLTIAPIFIFAEIIHLLRPAFFEPVMPVGVPHPHLVIMLTGAAELAGSPSCSYRGSAGWHDARSLRGLRLSGEHPPISA